jgi:uroporphyrinogen-III synthase
VIPAAVGPVTGARLRAQGVRFAVEPRSPRLGAMVQALAACFHDRAQTLVYKGHPIQIQGRLVSIDGVEVASLTDRERAVLRVLAERRGAVVSKRALMVAVWGEMGDEHVVEVTVARLRRRLGPVGRSIETVVRRGYRLAVDRPNAMAVGPKVTVDQLTGERA